MTASKTPLSDLAIENRWHAFTDETFRFLVDQAIPRYPDMRAAALARLEKGKAEYGDASFSAPEAALLDEIGQEFLDAYNWAFIAWCEFDDSMYHTIAAHAAYGYAKCAAMAEWKASLQPRSLNCIPTR